MLNHLGMTVAGQNSEDKSLSGGFMSGKEKNTLQLCRVMKCQNEPWLVSAEPPRKYVKHQRVTEGQSWEAKRACEKSSTQSRRRLKEIC